MNIISRINKLPIELRNKIFKYYWEERHFRIIENFHIFLWKLNKMLFFLVKHFVNNNSTKYNTQISYYLLDYNKFLREIRKNKGYDLFCKINVNGYNDYIFDAQVHNKILKNVDERLHQLCIFCIQEFTIQRYKILFDFQEITKHLYGN